MKTRDKIFILLSLFLCTQVSPSFSAEKSPSIKSNPTEELLNACESGDLKAVSELISDGADVNARNEYFSALGSAVCYGHIDIVKFLIAEGADVNAAGGVRKSTALMVAVQMGHNDITHYLLSQGANIDAEDIYERTALHQALYFYQLDSAEILISAGANYDYVARWEKLLGACQSGDIDTLSEMMPIGSYVMNRRGKLGSPPLTVAAVHGQIDTIKWLLSHGAIIDAEDEDGSTALHCAVGAGIIESVDVLIKAGADINYPRKPYGWESVTPLAYAVGEGYADIVELLLANDAKLFYPDIYSESGLEIISTRKARRFKYMHYSVTAVALIVVGYTSFLLGKWKR
jgi:ankyrin repeat protein